MVGTCSSREANEIQVLDFDEEANSLHLVGTLRHEGQVNALAPAPHDASLVATCGATERGSSTKVHRFDGGAWAGGDAWAGDDDAVASDGEGPGVLGGGDRPALTRRASEAEWGDDGGARPLAAAAVLGDPRPSPCVAVLWCPREHERPSSLAAVDATALRCYDVERPGAPTTEVAFHGSRSRSCGAAWSPHSATEIAVARRDGCVALYDARAPTKSSPASTIAGGGGPRLSVDYNPNKPFTIATGGADGLARIHDVRYDRPLKILKAHAGWCAAVAYNRYHDQLLATGGADRNVGLWRISSVSSAPLLDLELDDGEGANETDGASSKSARTAPSSAATPTPAGGAGGDAADVQVRDFDLHDDAVAGIAWSHCDAWCFASLSHDGRVSLNHVPSPEKYKILL